MTKKTLVILEIDLLSLPNMEPGKQPNHWHWATISTVEPFGANWGCLKWRGLASYFRDKIVEAISPEIYLCSYPAVKGVFINLKSGRHAHTFLSQRGPQSLFCPDSGLLSRDELRRREPSHMIKRNGLHASHRIKVSDRLRHKTE